MFGPKFERDGVRPRRTVISAAEFRGLPCRPESVTIGTSTHYRCGDSWYQSVEHDGWTCYAEIFPPAGATVTSLPKSAVPINAGGRTYYATDDAMYVIAPGGGYAVVEPPIGSRFDRLPAIAKGGIPVIANGTKYYRYLGVFYRAENGPSGESYIVAQSPFSANPAAEAKLDDAKAQQPLNVAGAGIHVESAPDPVESAAVPGSPRAIFLAY